MGLFTRSTLDSKINGAADIGQRAASGASDAVDTASDQLRSLLDDLESSLSSGKDFDADKLRKELQSKLKSARSQMNGASQAFVGRFNDAAGYADEFVHDKPWHTLGAVAGLALLVGFLAGRS
ncbi:Permeases of the major facilitator superfamily [Candidatus Burkholderia pumila]|uniref:Permeases of the major facilitator superfamily n=1 Tax=Candidatus Burkholderia pumila TaxID=1090375 RepID=A0ABR5HNS1_9BURK|nr:Permeases of the major facilitator superfamily [Candidatus Burkholderia pumila]